MLIKNRVSSVPVMDVTTNQFIGLLDMLGTLSAALNGRGADIACLNTDLLTLVVATSEAKELIDVLSRKEVDWETFIQQELEVFSNQTIGEMASTMPVTINCVSRINSNYPQTFLSEIRGLQYGKAFLCHH